MRSREYEQVAVKIIDKRRAKDDAYVRRNLRREGKLLQVIRHPNIVQLFEIMETENSYYLVTDICRGGDLMDHICIRKRLDEKETKRFVKQIISAVDYMHRLGILHRDLKVENLLLDENNDIKIIDFGLSNCVKVENTLNGVKTLEYCVTQCGSPAYAAPELLGNKKYGPQVDVWSIGINMYAMLTGSLPFTVEPFNIKILYNKMLNCQMNPIPDTISKEGRDLIKSFLMPDPEKRIRLKEAFQHPWISESVNRPMQRFPCPNKLRAEDLNNNIVKHMSEIVGFRLGDIIRYVTGNIPSAAIVMYHLLNRKLKVYETDMRAKGRVDHFDLKEMTFTAKPMPVSRQMIRRQTITKSFLAEEHAERKKEIISTRLIKSRQGSGEKAETHNFNEKKFVVDFTKHATHRKRDEFLDMFTVGFSTDDKESAITNRSSQKHKPHIPRTAKKYMVGDLYKKPKDKREAHGNIHEEIPFAKNIEPHNHPHAIISAKRLTDKQNICPELDNNHTENIRKRRTNNHTHADHKHAIQTLNELPLGIVDMRRPSHPNAILHNLYNGYFTGFFRKPASPHQTKKIIGLTYVTHDKTTNNDVKPMTDIITPSPPKDRCTTGSHVRHRLLVKRKLHRRASSQKSADTNIESDFVEQISPISFVIKPESMQTTVHSEPNELARHNIVLPSISPLFEMRNH